MTHSVYGLKMCIISKEISVMEIQMRLSQQMLVLLGEVSSVVM